MNTKRIKCILTGGCKFKSSEQNRNVMTKKRPVSLQRYAINMERNTQPYLLTNS